jgi:MerR family transcriptional regulator, copper efflux regulator
MLRYRESLGLLPVVRQPAQRDRRRSQTASAHRQFGQADLDAVALGLAIEQRYDISPAELAFGLRILADPVARAHVAELGRRTGRIRPLPAMAMDFEKERARRMLEHPPGQPASGPGRRVRPGPDSGEHRAQR